MKTSIAAFTVAVEEFLAARPQPKIGIAFLLTSDEEGPSVDGTVVVCEKAARARREAGLLHRGRTDLGGTPGRHDQERPARQPHRQADGQGHPGAHRLPAARQEPDPHGAAGAARAGHHRVGPRQRLLPAHQLPGEQHPWRHRRGQHHPEPGGGRFQLPLRQRQHRRGAAAARARHPGQSPARLRDGLDRGRPALPHHSRRTGGRGAGGDPRRHRPGDRTLHHRRHQRRPLHLQDLPAGDRVRPHQRHDPQDRRARARGRHRPAQGHLPARAGAPGRVVKLLALVEQLAGELEAAGVGYGHGTTNAFDEAAWLVLWKLGLPLDELDDHADLELAAPQQQAVRELVHERITSRKPAAYLTREAWLQGVPFYVDERAIVPRSFIAELLADGGIDPWLSERTRNVLDLCTGNGSLAVLAAMAYPEVEVDGADISAEALDVARINVEKHGLQDRVRLLQSDGLSALPGPYDLILCNPPYVNARSMARLPAEYRAEPELALAGGSDGMDFIRALLRDAPARMANEGVLVLEIGNEREHFEAAFPRLEAVWLETSGGEDQVLLLTRDALRRQSPS
ncbi:50S ribosomal protein L3 N(5)-glutamine methyltransferase [Ramlibacter sp. B156]|uniref:50S ribosomal protein L3 N(5)-glutamine methyltransferase n=1 Tax=Ramlibacter montanisoli TaxID=2732512 RepID=A0A849K3N7_9BURK|nr:50S ribosomal protein L3 N(5)-glutamine methyltransferase [Ramlibacter montanisoli]